MVLDADLDAPGVASMLAGHGGATAPWGIVDYLLERRVRGNAEPHIEDYYHQYAEAGVSGAEIFVYPAGTLNRAYVDKLARIDSGSEADGTAHPFVALLGQIRRELAPRWILIDAGAGFGEIAGFLTGGLCHLYVLLGTPADASWRGLELMLERLGGSRIREGKPQAECLLVASMVPRSDESLFKQLVQGFTDRARGAFSAHYYAAPQEALDTAWDAERPEERRCPARTRGTSLRRASGDIPRLPRGRGTHHAKREFLHGARPAHTDPRIVMGSLRQPNKQDWAALRARNTSAVT